MTFEQERWAEALAVIRMHGDGAETFIDQRKRELSADPDGLLRWLEIEGRVTRLRGLTDQSRH